jgi:hypothetical protein
MSASCSRMASSRAASGCRAGRKSRSAAQARGSTIPRAESFAAAGIFRGPEISLAPRGTPLPVPFEGQILDALPPDVRAVTDADVAEVQEEARALVRSQALARTRGASLAARSFSDFARVNRVEGLAVGGGLTGRLGSGFSVTGRGRYGLSDERAKGRGELTYRRASGAGFTFAVYDDYREVGDQRETSQVISSIAAQEFGSDYTDLYGARGASLLVRSRPLAGWTLSAESRRDAHTSQPVDAEPSNGRYKRTVAASLLKDRRIILAADRPTRLAPLGFEAQANAEASFISFALPDGDARWMSRFALRLGLEKPMGRSRFVSRSFAAWTTGGEVVPNQNLVFLGGPTTAPGYDFHELTARAGAYERVEIQFPVPFVSFPLGRYGRTPASLTLAPFFNAAWIDRPVNPRFSPSPPRLIGASVPASGWHPSVGVGTLALFDLLRLDVARGLRDGRWTFNVDVSRDFWGIL